VFLQVRDDNIAFVQTCWTFINSDSLLTWAQKVGLDFHFAVEQRARSFLGHFFNFNGTAGVLVCLSVAAVRACWRRLLVSRLPCVQHTTPCACAVLTLRADPAAAALPALFSRPVLHRCVAH
jgi:hypothetical protein